MYYYMDTSALIKKYIDEVGSTQVRELIASDDNEAIVTALITKAETGAALAAKVRNHTLSKTDYDQIISELDDDFSDNYTYIDLEYDIVTLAIKLAEKHKLRGYDSVQLATAVQSQTLYTPMKFVCADKNLLNAAINEGFEVIEPLI